MCSEGPVTSQGATAVGAGSVTIRKVYVIVSQATTALLVIYNLRYCWSNIPGIPVIGHARSGHASLWIIGCCLYVYIIVTVV